MKNQKIVNIRAFAILIVVLGHSIILYSDSWNLFETTCKVPVLNVLKEIINIIQMPLFFSLSGFLFFYSSKKKTKSISFFINKFKRLMVPYFLIAFFWMIPIRMLINFAGYSNLSIVTIVKQILIGFNNGHLWYLYALFMIFILMFFIDRALQYFNSEFVYIVVFVILMVLSFNKVNLRFAFLNDAIKYAVWFYMGYLLNRYGNTVNLKVKIPTLIITILFLVLWLIFRKELLGFLSSFFSVLSIYWIFTDKSNKFINSVSDNSFGIYLFHSPLVYITYTYLPNVTPILVVLINFVGFGLLAFVLSCVVKRTRLKIIIGE